MMDVHYLRVLQKRYKYFESKPITELTNDEINEYLTLKAEIIEEMPEIVDFVKDAWETIKEALSPYIEAELKYRKKVKQNDQP